VLPLDGIRVLDMSRLLPGPFASMILGDFGAEVIKIEEPSLADYSRWAPPFYGTLSVYFSNVNRNKKSITLNLKSPEGRDIFHRLAEKADVVLETFRPGVVDRLGVAYRIWPGRPVPGLCGPRSQHPRSRWNSKFYQQGRGPPDSPRAAHRRFRRKLVDGHCNYDGATGP
jgi:hypothetical protein